MGVTWKPHEKHGELTERSDLPDTVFAFPAERKEPLTDAEHVPNTTASRCPNRIGKSLVALRRPAARPPIGRPRHSGPPRRGRSDNQAAREL
jgi:hypothetical protein